MFFIHGPLPASNEIARHCSARNPESKAKVSKNLFDRLAARNYAAAVQKGNASTFAWPQVRSLLRLPLPQSYTQFIGRKLVRFVLTVQGLGAFALITLGVILTKFRAARRLVWPLIFR